MKQVNTYSIDTNKSKLLDIRNAFADLMAMGVLRALFERNRQGLENHFSEQGNHLPA